MLNAYLILYLTVNTNFGNYVRRLVKLDRSNVKSLNNCFDRYKNALRRNIADLIIKVGISLGRIADSFVNLILLLEFYYLMA